MDGILCATDTMDNTDLISAVLHEQQEAGHVIAGADGVLSVRILHCAAPGVV